MRFPHVISTNAKEAYSPSDVSLKLLREADRKLFPENLEWGDKDVPALVTFCVRTISNNFEQKQILNELSCAERDLLLEILPTDLPLEIVVPLIDDEIYWKRRYSDKFGALMQRLYEHSTWKHLFIERYMQEVIEEAQPQYNDENNMDDITKLCCPYVVHLKISQLQAWKPPLTWDPDEIPEVYPIDHINFEPIFKKLQKIKELDIIYSMKKVAESFTWNMFKLSVLDCKRLGKAILSLKEIRILKLHRSRLGDDHVRALMHGIIHNKTLLELDLSHCLIEDQGALCIAKVMMVHPTLEIIKLCNNKIRGIGGQGIGFALLEETCCPLSHLDLRLNPLGHEGTMGILRAVIRGDKPRELNLAACLFEDDTPVRVGQMLRVNRTIEKLDVSSNWFGEEGGDVVVQALLNNKVLQWMDIRETDIPQHHEKMIHKLLKRNRLAEDEIEEEVEEEEIVIENLYPPEEDQTGKEQVSTSEESTMTGT